MAFLEHNLSDCYYSYKSSLRIQSYPDIVVNFGLIFVHSCKVALEPYSFSSSDLGLTGLQSQKH